MKPLQAEEASAREQPETRAPGAGQETARETARETEQETERKVQRPARLAHIPIADYDADGYDYQRFWQGREYEEWAESRVIRRRFESEFLIEGSAPWLVDLGAGFGRNLTHYRQFARRVVLVDYSWTNLRAAEAALARNPERAQQVYLVRANLYHLPFCDAAFDTGLTVRVLHHLADLSAGLREMGRVIQQRWLLDVPSKTHLRARLRAYHHSQWRVGADREPQELGDAENPYRNYHVGAVRDELYALGWDSRAVASVANLRGWEAACQPTVREAIRPVIYGVEALGQSLGRTWWGPSQWLWLTHGDEPEAPRKRATAAVGAMPDGVSLDVFPEVDYHDEAHEFVSRLSCPRCTGGLQFTEHEAQCIRCSTTYKRTGAIWDFASL